MTETFEFIYDRWSPEAKLLLSCTRTQMDATHAEQIRVLLKETIDWDELLEMASGHNLAPLLFRSLDAVAPTAIPKDIRAQLKKQLEVNIQGNLFLTKELLYLLALFGRHGIPVIPYKGPVLAASVYGDLGLRPSNDLDILVHERDILQAMDLLVAHGYQVIRPSIVARAEKSLRALQINQLIEGSLWAYQLILSHPERQGVVELHWRITPKYVFSNSTEELWENLVPVTLGGTTVCSFAPENLLWFLCLHGAKHQWKRLGWLCDIAELIRVYPDLDWEQVMAHSAALGIERRLYLGLALAHCLLKTPLPRPIEKKIRSTPQLNTLLRQVMETMFDSLEQAAALPYLERFAFQLRAMDRMTDRSRYLWRFATGGRGASS